MRWSPGRDAEYPHQRLTSIRVAALALVAIIAAGCGLAATATPTPSPTLTPVPFAGCTTSAKQGHCGPYDNYRQITGTNASTYVGNNVWNPIPGSGQILYATNPGSWHVTANMPAGNTAVISYPSIGANYGKITDFPTPLSSYSTIYSSFDENMNPTTGTSAWASFDIWLGADNCSPVGSKCTSAEVMIQHDFAHNGACLAVATVSFGGSGGVPVQNWNLCQFGPELVWKLVGRNERSGRVDILSMLRWLVTHRYLPANTGLWSIGYGWEICSTGGTNENFQVNSFSLMPTFAVPPRTG